MVKDEGCVRYGSSSRSPGRYLREDISSLFPPSLSTSALTFPTGQRHGAQAPPFNSAVAPMETRTSTTKRRESAAITDCFVMCHNSRWVPLSSVPFNGPSSPFKPARELSFASIAFCFLVLFSHRTLDGFFTDDLLVLRRHSLFRDDLSMPGPE